MRIARIKDGKVLEVMSLADDIKIEGLFHSSIHVAECPQEVAAGWLFNGMMFAPPPAVSLSRTDLLAYAALVRWQKEIGGITVAGLMVATDDRSKQMIMGARIAAGADSSFSTPWVGADGEIVRLSAFQIVGISDAVLQHVQNCFSIFADVAQAIGAVPPTITSMADIDAAFAD